MEKKRRRRPKGAASPVIGRGETYRVTVPKQIVEALRLEGALFKWRVIDNERLEIVIERGWREKS